MIFGKIIHKENKFIKNSQLNINAKLKLFKDISLPPKTVLNPPISTYLNSTFFGREFGVLVMVDSLSDKVIYHQIVSTERDEYYQLALNRFRNKNDVIQSVTCDGRRGLLKDLLNTATQMCHFHLVTMIMRKLRKKHKSTARKELKI